MNEMKFRFWCQKVLPSIYDDSLSYYELLCKIAKSLELAADEIQALENKDTELGGNIAALEERINTRISALEAEDREINGELALLKESGISLGERLTDVSEDVGELSGKIDNIPSVHFKCEIYDFTIYDDGNSDSYSFNVDRAKNNVFFIKTEFNGNMTMHYFDGDESFFQYMPFDGGNVNLRGELVTNEKYQLTVSMENMSNHGDIIYTLIVIGM